MSFLKNKNRDQKVKIGPAWRVGTSGSREDIRKEVGG
jgi:hypothetical protein